ncbi:MAG: N-acetyltransferase [Deltaproteobacteria bacterium]|nr:MAG: N-acetyltransferase [Deltaproteobacteria bacterium]
MDRSRAAALEEERQAVGVARIAHASLALAGGWLSGGPAGSWLNQAVGLGIGATVSESDLDVLDAFYAERGGNPEVLVCPYADPSLALGLGRRGYVLTGFEHVLGRGVDGRDVPGNVPEGLVIREVDAADPEQVEAWLDASTCGFRPEGEPVPELLRDGSLRMLADPHVTGLLAELHGEVVGGAALEVYGEIAALMATSVRAAARRRGVQQALIEARVRMARDAGAKLVTIQSEPAIGTERNALRAGFEVLYTRSILRPAAALAV